MALRTILSSLVGRFGGPPPPPTSWDNLLALSSGDVFVSPDQEAFDACEEIRTAFFPVLARYGIDANEFFGGSIKKEDAASLYALVRKARPKAAYQVGTFVGYSAMVIASALSRNACGTLTACDPEIPHRTLVNPVDVAREMAAVLGIDDRIRFVRGWHALPIGDGFPPEYVRSIPVAGREALQSIEGGVDFAFIDGDHSTTATTCDLALLHEFLNVEGTIVFHDVYSWPTVARAIENFMSDNYFYYRKTPHYYTLDVRVGPDGLAAVRRTRAADDSLLRIKILSAVSNEAVPHATVQLPSIPYGGRTGRDGSLYVFAEVPAHTAIDVQADGFRQTQQTTAKAVSGCFDELIVHLQPLP